MILKCLPTGMFGSNSYIIGAGGEGLVIDCGVDAGDIISAAVNEGIKIKYIVLTHSHIDHICSVDALRTETGAQVLIHEADAEAITDPVRNGSALFGDSLSIKKADLLIKDGYKFSAGGLDFEILHTPGHTPGGICVKVSNCVFTGDTLFKTAIGRTDLPGGSYDVIIASIKRKLMTLEDNMKVYPGHGGATTIGYERTYNPFI